MSCLRSWARKWGVSSEAIRDLEAGLGLAGVITLSGESEAAVQTRVRLDEVRRGGRLWRNNVGAAYMKGGGFLRYGLANESAQMNKVIKSSDLIGLRPVRITPHHVGTTIGQFVAREIKDGNWTYSGTEREIAQLAFGTLVIKLGGDFRFTNGSDIGTVDASVSKEMSNVGKTSG